MTRGRVAWLTKQLGGKGSGSKHSATPIEQNWHQNVDAFSWTLVVYEF